MIRLSALRCLAALLRSEQPGRALDERDWTSIIELANDHRLGPALHVAIASARGLDTAGWAEPLAYLDRLHRLNGARNEVLRHQAAELIEAFNGANIVPLAFKGGVALFDDLYADPAARMVGDLDLLVPGATLPQALEVLRALDYREQERYEQGHNAYGNLVRAGSPAAIDLHLAPVEVPHLLSAEEVWRDAEPLAVAGSRALRESPTHQALHCLVHAQIHHLGGYYRGVLKLNELFDLVTIARRYDAHVDWAFIEQRYADNRLTPALHSFLLAARQLFGLRWPLSSPPGGAATLHYARCLMHLQWPILCGLAMPWANLRRSFAWHRMNALYRDRPAPMPWRLRHLLRFLARRRLAEAIGRVFRTR